MALKEYALLIKQAAEAQKLYFLGQGDRAS